MAASDNLKENYTTVVIHVKDVNDNPPVFERPTYRTQITEEDDRNLPKRVLQVFANIHQLMFFSFGLRFTFADCFESQILLQFIFDFDTLKHEQTHIYDSLTNFEKKIKVLHGIFNRF